MSMNVSGVTASQADINAVLDKMRMLRSQAQVGAAPLSGADADVANSVSRTNEPRQADFGAALKGAIDSVNHLQQTSSATANDFLTGKSNDLVKVMVDSQKASLGFQAMVQTRNRVISAYQDIMKMPI